MDIAGNAEKAIRMVREAKNLVYDTETSGVDWKHNSVVGYVIGAPEKSGVILPENVVYVPIRHGGGGNIVGGKPMKEADDDVETHTFEEELARAFGHRNSVGHNGRIVGHHTKFDCHMSANHGIYLGRRMACTQNQAALLDEYAGKYGLQVVAERMGVTAKKSEDMYAHLSKLFGIPNNKEAMAHFWRTAGNDPVAVDYSCGDGVTTWEVYVRQNDQIADEEIQTVVDLENDLLWTLFRMERRGIRVDLDEITQLRRETEAQINENLQHFPVGFNTRSPKDMKKVMTDAGHTDWPKTAKGNPSFTEKWLEKSETGRRIVSIRQLTNLLNSFVNPLSERHVHNGRVHATLNQLKNDEKGTISGRFSCSNPNLQQVPKRNKSLAKPFRRLFVADPGYVFWERDYSQCEPRLFAHYSQDPKLLEGYNQVPHKDMHSVTAELLGVERDPTAKRMGMGILTGMQAASLAGHMGCSEAQAKTWLELFLGDAYPRIRQFQNNAKARLKNRGYVYTLLGRRCRLEHPRFAYRGTSKIIQGGNADIIKYKLLHADRMCEDNGDIVQILMTVHDSYNGQREDTPEAKALLGEILAFMEDVKSEPFNLTVPFLLEGEEGPNWSVATFGE